MAGGSYGGESLSAAAKSGTGRVVFRPASGATVTMTGEFRLTGQNHIELQNMTVGGMYLTGGANDIVFQGVNTSTLYFRVVSNISLLGGSVGGTCMGYSATVGSGVKTGRAVNILIDGVHFHDITRDCNASAHVECLFVQESSYVTIQNSSFTNCGIMDVYVHEIGGGGDPDHIIIQNNSFATTTDGGFYALVTQALSGETLNDYLIQGNSFAQTPAPRKRPRLDRHQLPLLQRQHRQPVPVDQPANRRLHELLATPLLRAAISGAEQEDTRDRRRPPARPRHEIRCHTGRRLPVDAGAR